MEEEPRMVDLLLEDCILDMVVVDIRNIEVTREVDQEVGREGLMGARRVATRVIVIVIILRGDIE